MKSIASAAWKGGLKDGTGTLSSEGGALQAVPYSFGKRFEGTGPGTTPEELIAAAHAGCFAMAMSSGLGNAGFTAERLDVKSTVNLQPVNGKPTITGSHLEMTAKIPGINDAQFQEIAQATRAGCVVSRALGGVEITLEAKLA